MAPPKRPLQSCPLRTCTIDWFTSRGERLTGYVAGRAIPAVCGLYRVYQLLAYTTCKMCMYYGWIWLNLHPVQHNDCTGSNSQVRDKKCWLFEMLSTAACRKHVNSIHRKPMCITQVAHQSHCSNNIIGTICNTFIMSYNLLRGWYMHGKSSVLALRTAC